MRYWARVTVTVMVIGGALTWALAGFGNHIGASGVAFGYFGAILGAAVFERRPRALAAALLVIVFYGGMVAGDRAAAVHLLGRPSIRHGGRSHRRPGNGPNRAARKPPSPRRSNHGNLMSRGSVE